MTNQGQSPGGDGAFPHAAQPRIFGAIPQAAAAPPQSMLHADIEMALKRARTCGGRYMVAVFHVDPADETKLYGTTATGERWSAARDMEALAMFAELVARPHIKAGLARAVAGAESAVVGGGAARNVPGASNDGEAKEVGGGGSTGEVGGSGY